MLATRSAVGFGTGRSPSGIARPAATLPAGEHPGRGSGWVTRTGKAARELRAACDDENTIIGGHGRPRPRYQRRSRSRSTEPEPEERVVAVVRYVYLRIEALSSRSPLAPVLCSRRRGRDCMRIPGHELGRVTPAEIFASTVDAVELGATRRQCRGTGRGDRSISTSGSYSAPGANGPSRGTEARDRWAASSAPPP